MSRRRDANQQLRVLGRGGIVTVSLSLAAAGEQVIVEALRAVAAQQTTFQSASGEVMTTAGLLRWTITNAGGAANQIRVFGVWLAAEE